MTPFVRKELFSQGDCDATFNLHVILCLFLRLPVSQFRWNISSEIPNPQRNLGLKYFEKQRANAAKKFRECLEIRTVEIRLKMVIKRSGNTGR